MAHQPGSCTTSFFEGGNNFKWKPTAFGETRTIRIDNGDDYKYLGLMVSNLGVYFVGDREGDKFVMEN